MRLWKLLLLIPLLPMSLASIHVSCLIIITIIITNAKWWFSNSIILSTFICSLSTLIGSFLFSPFIYLFIHYFYQCELISFLFFSINYDAVLLTSISMLELSQIWPVGPLQAAFCVLLTVLVIHWALPFFLSQNIGPLILSFLCSIPRIDQFYKELWFLLRERGFQKPVSGH